MSTLTSPLINKYKYQVFFITTLLIIQMQVEDLFRLVKFGKYEHVLSKLIEVRAQNQPFNFSQRDKFGRNILHWACYCGTEPLFLWILQNDIVNINQRDYEGYTPLELSILNRDKNLQVQTKFVKALLEKGATIAHFREMNECPLHWAFYFENLDLIDLLIGAKYKQLYRLTDNDLYPIDYLFFDLKPHKYWISGLEREIFNHVVLKIYSTLGIMLPNNRPTNIVKFKDHTEIQQKKSNRPSIEPSIAYRGVYLGNKPHLSSQVFSSGCVTPVYQNISNNRANKDNEEPEVEEIKISKKPITTISQQLTQIKMVSPTEKQKKGKSYRVYQDESVYNRRTRAYLKFQLRLLFWSAHFDEVQLCQFFLERRCSPFVNSYKGQNAFQRAAARGSIKCLKLFLTSNFHTRPKEIRVDDENIRGRKRRQLEKDRLLNLLTLDHPSTALHLAIENEYYDCAKLLVEHGASTKIVNYRNMQPFKLTSNEQVLEIYQDFIRQGRRENFYEKGYLYVLKTKGKKKISHDIVFIQLLNIQQRFEDMGMQFEFNIIYGHTSETILKHKLLQENNPVSLFYVIKMTPETIYRLAEKYNFYLYHLRNKTSQLFKYHEKMQFEFPKDLDIQQLILLCLNEEFDVEKFLLEGLLLQHFPIQDENKYSEMVEFWNTELNNCIRDTMFYNTDWRSLRPLHSMSQYYGPVIGWYFAFLVQLAAWLAFPSLMGLFLIFYCFATSQIDSMLFPFYGFIMMFWGTLFLESWKRRENEFAFSWDMHLYKKREKPRVMYQGQFVLSQLDSHPDVFDKFTTFNRRLIMDGPVILFGIGTVIAQFIFVQYLSQIYLEKQRKNTFGTILFGTISGVLMNITSAIYKHIVNGVVLWENHKFDSEYQFSYTLKLFIFEFINSYISLIYQCVYQSDRSKLAISVATITLTRGYFFLMSLRIIQNLNSNIIPYIHSKYRMKKNQREFDLLSKFYDIDAFQLQRLDSQQSRIDLQNLDNDSHRSKPMLKTLYEQLSLQNLPALSNQTYVHQVLNIQEQMELLHQLQIRDYMSDQKHLIDEYTDLAIQFGYVTMFATAFPPASILFMINCYMDLRFSLHNYTNVVKREVTLITYLYLGIWLNIFNMISYSSTIMNCVIIWNTYPEKFEEVVGKISDLKLLALIIGFEHIVMLFKYIIAELIDDVPSWVRKELQRQEHIKNRND